VIQEKTHNDICDLCGLAKDQSNKACPQHRMWDAESEVERLKDLQKTE